MRGFFSRGGIENFWTAGSSTKMASSRKRGKQAEEEEVEERKPKTVQVIYTTVYDRYATRVPVGMTFEQFIRRQKLSHASLWKVEEPEGPLKGCIIDGHFEFEHDIFLRCVQG